MLWLLLCDLVYKYVIAFVAHVINLGPVPSMTQVSVSREYEVACDGHRRLQVLSAHKPSHSAIDLTTALLCDIRQAWEEKRVAGLTAVDVKGAFDGVLCNRLILRLRSQGWPDCLVQWVSSFLSKRQVRIRVDHTTTDALPILCGLPQGSPVSPILFLLYIEPLLRLSRGRFWVC